MQRHLDPAFGDRDSQIAVTLGAGALEVANKLSIQGNERWVPTNASRPTKLRSIVTRPLNGFSRIADQGCRPTLAGALEGLKAPWTIKSKRSARSSLSREKGFWRF